MKTRPGPCPTHPGSGSEGSASGSDAPPEPAPQPVGELWKRCVKVTYMGGYKPTGEAQLALDVEQAGGAPFVNAKLKKKSAVLLFSCTADAEDLVHGVGDSCDKFTASIVPPPNAGSPK